MHKLKVLLPVFLGITITAAVLMGLPHQETAYAAPTADIYFVDVDAAGTASGLDWTNAFTNLQNALAIAVSGYEIWVAEGVYYPDEGTGQTDDNRNSYFNLVDGVEIYGGFNGSETLFSQRDWESNITVLSGDIDQNDLTNSNGVITSTANITGTNAYWVVRGTGVSASAVLDGFTITAGDSNDTGGGLYNNSSSPILSNLIFIGNRATKTGAGMRNELFSSPVLTNVYFFNNTAVSRGGGMYNTYGSDPSLTNVVFSHNSADAGGGIYNYNNSITLVNVTFSNNEAVSYGGAIQNYAINPSSLTNISIYGNSANYGGGMHNHASHPTLKNVIMWGNTANISYTQISNNGSNPPISFSNIQGSGGSGSWDSTLGADGGGNIDSDPLFVDPANDDLHLRLGSPSIDTGTNTGCPADDLDGNSRPVNSTCDMGAYESLFEGMLYVDVDATGAATGLNWTDAFTNPQDALAVAPAGSQIWVAEGIYFPDEGSGQTGDDRTSTFALVNGVEIYGGFTGTETLLSQRNWETNITVLSGDIDQDDSTNTNGVVTDSLNISGSNAYHVVDGSGVTETVSLDGFTITAGNANVNNANSKNSCGGGLYNNSGHPTLSNLVFSGNWAFAFGGGLYNTFSNPLLTNVTFIGNHSDNRGGGMDNRINSSPILNNLTFINNSSQLGGGMFNTSNSHPTLTNITFTNNSARNYGGGMYNESNSNPELNNVEFFNNTAERGAGMQNHTSSPILKNVTFSNNSATNWGGGLYNYKSSPVITNVVFYSNTAVYGGGIYNRDGSNHPILTNVTFHNNTADYGGGIYNNSSASYYTLKNAILWGNTAAITGNQITNSGSSVYISYSNIQGSGGSESWDTFIGVDNGGNIDADPRFVNPSNGDLHQNAGSPVIDAGTNDGCPVDDLDGVSRPVGLSCDMGAYEMDSYSVQFVKSVDDNRPEAGQTITFTLNLTNTGPGLTNGLISDTLPVGFNFLGPITLDSSGAGSAGTEPPVLASNLVISSNHQITVTFPVTVSLDITVGLLLENVASFTSTEITTPVTTSIPLVIDGNFPPVAENDPAPGFEADFTTTNDSAFNTTSVLVNDTDNDGDVLVVESIHLSGTLGLVTHLGYGVFHYDPNGQFDYLISGQQATDIFTYTVSDGNGGMDSARVTITILDGNNGPTAVDDSGDYFTTYNNAAFWTVSVLMNDTDPDDDPLMIESIDLSGTLGTVVHLGYGVFSYDPNGQFDHLAAGEEATDTFTYTVSDGNGGTDTATVTITIVGEPVCGCVFIPLVQK